MLHNSSIPRNGLAVDLVVFIHRSHARPLGMKYNDLYSILMIDFEAKYSLKPIFWCRNTTISEAQYCQPTLTILFPPENRL